MKLPNVAVWAVDCVSTWQAWPVNPAACPFRICAKAPAQVAALVYSLSFCDRCCSIILRMSPGQNHAYSPPSWLSLHVTLSSVTAPRTTQLQSFSCQSTLLDACRWRVLARCEQRPTAAFECIHTSGPHSFPLTRRLHRLCTSSAAEWSQCLPHSFPAHSTVTDQSASQLKVLVGSEDRKMTVKVSLGTHKGPFLKCYRIKNLSMLYFLQTIYERTISKSNFPTNCLQINSNFIPA